MIQSINKESIMKEVKCRNTLQQQKILDVFYSLNHPSAPQVYEKVKSLYPTIGRATVYRVLKKNTQSGDIMQINNEDACVFYDKNTCYHPHLYCVKCGKISDLPYEQSFTDCYKNLQNSGCDFTPLGIDFKVIGICRDCKNKA